MALTEMALTAIILVLVFLSLTVAPTWPMAFLILFGMIASQAIAFAKKISLLPISGPASALADDDTDDNLASAVDADGGMRRQPEPSSISSSLSGFKYDVYLSLQGRDTRHGIADHIYTKLADAGIRVFRSEEDELIVETEIWPVLKEAIKKSRILIPILSRDYASSKICLNELVQMWECMQLNGQTILPIFYELSPLDVRYMRGEFGEYLHRFAMRYDSKTLETWKEVLQQIGKLRGYLWEKRDRPESLLVKEVAASVVRVLNEDVGTDRLVGIDDHVKEMMIKLDVDSSDGKATERGEGVRVVGVYGERGVGKTTLAKVVFKKTHKFFEACSFLEGISSKGIEVSRRKLIADLQKEKPAPLESSGEEIEEMASLCRNVKVLIVLDDVDKDEQIRALAGNLAWFGPGSRIIVTTKKKNVLNAFDVGTVEEHLLKPMDQGHAHKLFCKHAFQGYAAQDVSEYFGLSMDIAEAIGGLPSAIVHQASSLRNDMNMVRWETTLDLLQKKSKKFSRFRP